MNVLVWTIVGLYLTTALLINIPVVQSFIGSQVALALSQKLNTKVGLGRVDLGLLNRIIIDDVRLSDQKNKELLRASRLSAKFDYLELLKGNISISSAQLFGMKANLYKETADSKPNFQFILDSLASKDTTQHKPLNIELKSLIIRHGELSYHQLDIPKRPQFDFHHLHIRNLSSHLLLNTLRDDSINLYVKRLSMQEESGIDVKSLTFKLISNNKGAELKNFELLLPSSQLRLGDIKASYSLKNKKINPASIRYDGSILSSIINPRDIASFAPLLKKFNRPILLQSSFSGTSNSLQLHAFEVSVPHLGKNMTLSSPSDIRISVEGYINSWDKTPIWSANIRNLLVDNAGMEMLAGDIPEVVERMKYFSYRGRANGYGKNISTRGVLKSGTGNADVTFDLHDKNFTGHVKTDGFNLSQLLNNDKFGQLATNINLAGNLRQKYYQAKGTVSRIDYNGYSYHNVVVDGSFDHGLMSGKMNVNDPNLIADINGALNTNKAHSAAHLTANVSHFNPSALKLLEKQLGNATYSANIVASFTGNSLNSAMGNLSVTQLRKKTSEGEYALDSLLLKAGNNQQGHYLTLHSDFAQAQVTGKFDYKTLVQSLKNAIVRKLPSIQQLTPIKYRRTPANDFSVQATVNRTDWLREFFGISVELPEPMRLSGSMSHGSEDIEANIFAPKIIYNGNHYKDVSIVVSSPNNDLNADISVVKIGKNGIGAEYRLEASATDDRLISVFSLDNHARQKRLMGRLNSTIQFSRNNNGVSEARMTVSPSQISVGDSTFTIHPSSVTYSKNHLEFNDFLITSGSQHISINGVTTKDSSDSLLVDLNHVNVNYILNLVNFHAVEFSGHASGRAYVSHLFGQPEARGRLQVDDFRFQNGRMGTLYAKVDWNRAQEEIDIDAQAIDTMLVGDILPKLRTTTISGYVSPKRNYIDLGITAKNSRGEFVESFCSSFMDHTDLTANGKVRVWGDLKDINLTGELVVNGKMGITPLNTQYTLHNDTIRCLINEIKFVNDTVYDRNGNSGIVTGSLYHDHLSQLTYDIKTKARNFLAYDWGPTYGSTFYGTVYGTGDVNIKGKSGEVNIDVNVTPQQGSQVVYDVASPTTIGSREFIHWNTRDTLSTAMQEMRLPRTDHDSIPDNQDEPDIPTDIHINFLINTNPDATLKLIMDKATGDYINLNGSGVIRASYYNKGGLDIFGNYLIDHGIYKLTIQNVIKRDFSFAQGGTIVFGGDPYAANLNLTAQYTVNSVSLSDLQIGKSFSSNNIRVNCIMNITGTPAAPKIDFSMDMPTIGTDAKQMIYSLINSEEEMNQQVLYLLAVGRFYSQGSNNASSSSTTENQTSLAMQSILSGQLSQQLNTVLNSVVKNVNWNVGANISPGNEGWNNAEYEGLLSGRMLNNRLLFNGQFGYRDNSNATTSFIGDFDLRYLITPNGNLSVHVYNQTNDRYFTRNSLNTQGIGFILKKDFDSWKSLFGLKKKKVKPVTEPKK
ncbi:MAG: translocation/assembly module TamB domain-containing protein [Prevotella sp.]|nr:translocation/assembly module TamB domain-containing protein [Prevotella sp.]